MNRKSIGAQIRSVFNVPDPFSKEFSEDSDDDETIFNQSSKHNSTQDSQSSVNYLAHWSNIEKEASSMFVNLDSSNVSLDTTAEIAANVTPSGLYNYFGMPTPDDTKSNQKRQSAVSIEIPQENLRDFKVEPKSLNLSLDSEEEDATFDSNARHATPSTDLRKKIFQNVLHRKVIDFESSQTDVLLAPDTPENNSQDMFKYDSEIIPDSDTSVLSTRSLYDI